MVAGIACRNGTSIAVLFVDLDGFRNVNDTQGHDASDEVLKRWQADFAAACAKSIQQNCGHEETQQTLPGN
jgi:diguanylate cyclase (GGDEF)-like protein